MQLHMDDMCLAVGQSFGGNADGPSHVYQNDWAEGQSRGTVPAASFGPLLSRGHSSMYY